MRLMTILNQVTEYKPVVVDEMYMSMQLFCPSREPPVNPIRRPGNRRLLPPLGIFKAFTSIYNADLER